MSRQHVRRVLPLGLAMALFSSVSTAQERLPVADARPLLLAAIDAPDGRAHGVLSGPMADAITARFNATSPVHIDVSTERRYAQSGCRRLKVSFWQDGVQLPGEPSARRRTIDFGINYCRDGLPPRSLS
ncbi:hypothetical protein [Methylibium petroleiphilum]|uniref:hypothetical protein n=1 Tax=Methylibium petroleiphilum TaxID=105560 RepID=UPI001ACEC1F6|nr:hypothetical protein [Methylibium petroleiphilum]MBN9206328.1 hypothetical protein [Methylibium petroleiphilum]